MFFVERYIILCPYLGGSTIGGSTVLQSRVQNLMILCSSVVASSFHLVLCTTSTVSVSPSTLMPRPLLGNQYHRKGVGPSPVVEESHDDGSITTRQQ